MKEKHHRKGKLYKTSKHEKHALERKKKLSNRTPSSPSSSESHEWVEKHAIQEKPNMPEREDWMSMMGQMKTYTKDDIKPREEKEKKRIDSYNPATSCRELNPYWKKGGTGLPQSSNSFRKSNPFLKPSDEDDYYSRSSSSKQFRSSEKYDRDSRQYAKHDDDRDRKSSSSCDRHDTYHRKSYNWKKGHESSEKSQHKEEEIKAEPQASPVLQEKPKGGKYLSDEKMNKLAAKIVKAEIVGNSELVEELKSKLEAAREYRTQNPNATEDNEDDSVILISTNTTGNSRPLTKPEKGDPRSKGSKRKAETHTSGQRTKYFGNDDRYNLAEMFQQEKYGNNYDDEAQLSKIATKHKNPNDDLDDIFVDEISKTRNEATDSEKEKQRAIKQHTRMEKTLEGCEYCVDSKNMLKHLMVSCGTKTYLALPAKKSLVQGQCIISTIQHLTCVTSLDEDVWEEILNYRKALTQFFSSQNKDVVFFETATRLHRFPHVVINCVPLPRDVGDMAAIYFKKALLECEAEWSMNKKVVELKGKNVRKGVPKGLPYFWIDFGMDPGFAHIIEDQQLFPRTFAEEIIAGILDLEHHSWKNPQKEYRDLQRKKVLDFLNQWKPFDTISKKD